MTARNRALGVYEVANWLGFDVPAERPRTKVERALARRGLNTFYMSMNRGLVPQPDFRLGRTCRWFEDSIRKFLEMKSQPTAPMKRGRRSKMAGAAHA